MEETAREAVNAPVEERKEDNTPKEADIGGPAVAPMSAKKSLWNIKSAVIIESIFLGIVIVISVICIFRLITTQNRYESLRLKTSQWMSLSEDEQNRLLSVLDIDEEIATLTAQKLLWKIKLPN